MVSWIRRVSLGSALLLVLLGGHGRAQATPGLTFTGTTLGGGSDFMAGWRFDVNQAITVSALGFWDNGSDGLAQSHEVGIWTNAGVLVTSTTLPAGTSAVLDSGFRFESIAPVLLNPGTYRIGAYYAGTTDGYVVADAVASTIPEITYLDRAFKLASGGFVFPSDSNSLNLAGNFGPNFATAATGVPAPTPLVLVGLGLAAVGLSRRAVRTLAGASRTSLSD